MKKRILTVIMILAICFSSVLCVMPEVHAEETGEDLDYSYLATDSALIGYAPLITRGVYLVEGYSIINKISSTKIGAGGVTNAAVSCKVTVIATVERQTSTGWAYVTSWTQTNTSALSAMVSKSLTVGTGYYYRVRCNHYAGSDSSSSGTGSLKM